MDSRERVFRALERSQPDRLPIFQQLLPGARLQYGARLDALLGRYPSDFSDCGYYGDSEYGPAAGLGHQDAWGAVWTRVSDDYKGQVTGHPLADWAALATYLFPDPARVGDFSRVIETIRTNPGRRYLMADGDTLFQRMFYLRGFENLMLDLAERHPEAALDPDPPHPCYIPPPYGSTVPSTTAKTVMGVISSIPSAAFWTDLTALFVSS